MNKRIVNALYAFGGLFAGCGIGYLFGYRKAKKKYKDTAVTVFKFETPEPSKSEEEPKQSSTVNEELHKVVTDLNYAPPEPPITDQLIYPISIDEFAMNRVFDNVVVYWYDEDGILQDAEGEEMDPNDTVGSWNLDPDLFMDGELHVRNERLGVDYTIILENHHITDSIDYPGWDDE